MGTIKVTTSFHIIQFIFFFFRPLISIDGGEAQKTKWGETTYDVAPGEHTVFIEIPYFFFKVGKASSTVAVAAGETVSVSYKPPWIVFMEGDLQVA